MPNMMGGLSLVTFGSQSCGALDTYWVPNAQLQWQARPAIYDSLDDISGVAHPYLEDPMLGSDSFYLYSRPFGLRGSNQMQQLLAT